MKSFLTTSVVWALLLPIASADTEIVSVVKVLENGDKGIIERGNGETWLIEKGVGAISFSRFEGKKVLIQYPGLFCGIGSKLILPDVGQEARIWNAEQIVKERNRAAVTSAPSDSELTVAALTFLGYYSPKAKDKRKSDAVLAFKAFQRHEGLYQTGKMSSATQLALSKAVSSRRPATRESLTLASSLLDSARRLTTNSETGQPDGTAGAGGSSLESQIDGDFEGWQGETVVKLTNGQIWQQSEYYYHYHYAFMPKAVILSSGGRYTMVVDGVPKAIGVRRLK